MVTKASWLPTCLEVACACLAKPGDPSACKCAVLEDYVKQCRRLQPSIHLEDWRTMHLCRESPLP